MKTPLTIHPIATIDTPFKEKFGIPRQGRLVPSACGKIRLIEPYNKPDTVKALETFSHIWVIFLFHQHLDRNWSPLIRPPRLGGNEKVGVFASRSTFRPNMIGQSVIKLEAVHTDNNQVILDVSGIDLLDQTPIIDIKPYIPYSDSIPDADGSFANLAPSGLLNIMFTLQASRKCSELETESRPNLRALITEVLQQDPRPAYRKSRAEERIYGVQLFDLNIRFTVNGDTAQIEDIQN